MKNSPAVIQTNAIERMASADRRSQIEVAKQFPRDLASCKRRATEMATADQGTAAGCFYSIPRGGSNIEGPSVRLAEIIASTWGNIRAGARVIDTDETHVIAEGAVWDLESNVAVSLEVRRKITDRNGKRFSDDMITVTGNAASSIAFRNAVFKTIPAAYVTPVYEAAKRAAIGEASTIASTRRKAVAYALKFGVDNDALCAAFGRESVEDLTAEDLQAMRGRFNAIRDDEITVDEAFAPKGPPKEGRQSFARKRPETAPEVDLAPGEHVDTETGEVIAAEPRTQADTSTRTANHGIGIAISMIGTCQTVAVLDAAVEGDKRKTVIVAYGERRDVLAAAEAKAAMTENKNDEGVGF